MTKKIPIRNNELPNNPRVFDVTVSETGEILRYDMKNIRGPLFINDEQVREQINEYLEKR